MSIKFIEITEEAKKSDICKKILESLPMWFGLPKSNLEYCERVKNYRFIGIYDSESEIGFVSLKRNSEFVVELYVLGLLDTYHRKGIGKLMMQYICEDLKSKGIQYLEVKTLDESRESDEYRKTRLFYMNEGFISLDVLKNEWGEDNPCLILIKRL